MKNKLYLFLIPLAIFLPSFVNADIDMGSGGISEIYIYESGQLDPGTFPWRIISPSLPGICKSGTGISGLGLNINATTDCGDYWITYGDTITVETETDTGNPTQTGIFYYNCQDPEATNYDPTWTIDTGECAYEPIVIDETPTSIQVSLLARIIMLIIICFSIVLYFIKFISKL